MANLLQSSQTQATCAPSFYTNYLSNLATAGQKAQAGAQYACAQPLQTQAFTAAANQAGQFQPLVTQAAGLVGQGANQNIVGATTPYLNNIASPLCAAKPLINQGTNFNLGQAAQCYMNPYIQCQINTMSNIGQRNIMQNLAPQATAAAVGSGQFGSQRGAQVLGQTVANAEQCLNANIANLLASGYGSALQAAGTKQGALANLAGTTATAQQAQNAAQIQAAQTAEQAAQQQAALGIQGGQALGTLGTQGQQINLGCLNALSTLGGQQQTIAQNKQCYPLTTLSKLSSLLAGANVPTKTTTTLCMSPLSAVAGVGAGVQGLLTPYKCAPTGSPKNLLCSLTGSSSLSALLKGSSSATPSTTVSNSNDPYGYTYCFCTGENIGGTKSGGSIKAPVGCVSTRKRGALPGRG
jgi:hypothetical protein